ncbi:DUF7927 domain-containing protein [Chitinophaga nivalis]|uniref:Gliding motility-associated C-terminal domain-containing protein n=1 Tax=Chitinophaga nivalis TaxID=2991709 RepID=A0ABT3IWQ1_9BACT|nr:gliding motility-associated C-terminal domain-containing protein [Chitinophaga nivalis]MCW3461912.1 gliding motility-associated C-terminal domain-containing protein [Chitinophaga nivalis]MCW3488397.1 gliding motility-associated C-terminal domain-containing protein [Chitinophaga nivalis]
MGVNLLAITPTAIRINKRFFCRYFIVPFLFFFLYGLPAHAQFTITEDFKGNSQGDITLGGAARLTSGTVDPTGAGWLRLTEDVNNQVGYAYVNQGFPSTLGVLMDFEYVAWRRQNPQFGGGDGFSVFLFNDNVTNFTLGSRGGSLGYSQSTSTGNTGLSGGYVGIGIDEFGNYGNCGDGKVGGFTANCSDQFPDYISARGPAPNYAYVGGARVNASIDYDPLTPTRPTSAQFYRRVQVEIMPTGTGQYEITVRWKTSPNGAFTTIFGPFVLSAPPPPRLKLGFAASTGLANNNHEVRNLIITTPGNIRVQKLADKPIARPGGPLTYRITAYNETTSQVNNLPLKDIFSPTNGFNISNVSFSNDGFSGNTATGYTSTSLSSARLNMAAKSSSTFTITGTVNGKPPGGILTNTTYVEPAATGISDADASNDTSRVNTQIITPDLAITKTHNGSIRKGLSGNYVLTVRNVGTDDKPGPSTVTINDVVPAGLIAGIPSGTGWSFAGTSGNTIVATRTDQLAAGASYPPITIPVRVPVNAPHRIINTATVQNEYESNTTNNTANDTLDTRRNIDLELVSLIVPPSKKGCVLKPYNVTVTVRNNGPDSAVNARFNFAVPTALNVISLVSRNIVAGSGTFGTGSSTGPTGYTESLTLTSGGTATYVFAVTVTDPAPADLAIANAYLLRSSTDLDIDASDPTLTNPTDPQHECDALPSGPLCNNIRFDTVIVTAPPTPANAGPDRVLCNVTTINLAGNTPALGKGIWTQASGPNTATINNPAVPNTSVSGLVPGTYNFVWSISNGGCTTTTDTVQIRIDIPPSIAQAGPDQQLCNVTSTTLAGNTPVSGKGGWRQASGPNAAVFADTTLPNTGVSGLAAGTYTFIWTIRNGGCTPSADTVLVTVSPTSTQANAGPDQELCNVGVTTLAGNTPAAGTGRWTQVAGPNTATIGNPASPNTSINNLVPGTYSFVWTISSGACAATKDTVQILLYTRPDAANAGPDQIQYNSGVFNMNANIPVNGTGKWTLAGGNATIGDPANPKTTMTLQPNTTATLVWSVTNGNCAAATDTVVLRYVRQADLKIVKSDAGNTYKTGSTLTYTITAENLGPSDVSGADIQDLLPAAMENPSWTAVATGAGVTVTPTSGSGRIVKTSVNIPVAAGNKVVLTVTGTIAATAKGGDVLYNSALITIPVSTPDPDHSNNVSEVTGTVPNNPPIAVDDRYTTKRDVPVSGNVLTNDSDPENQPLTVTTTPVTPPQNGTVQQRADGTFTYTPNPGFTGTDSYVYQVCDNQGACATATVTIIVQAAEMDLTVSKVANPTNAVAGQALTYTITVTNNGPSTLQPGETFVVRDQLPAGFIADTYTPSAGIYTSASGNWTGVTLRSGNSVTLSITGKVSASFAGGSLSNTVAVTPPPDVTDPTPGKDTLVTPVGKTVEVVVTKTDNTTTYTPGTNTTYQITITNNGPSDLTGGTFTDPLPAGITVASWSVTATDDQPAASGSGSINQPLNIHAGKSIVYTLTLSIPSGFTGPLVNKATATVPAGYNNINPAGNTATDTDNPDPQSDLSIVKTGPASEIAGTAINYQITVLNNGPSDVSNVTIADILPAQILNPTWTVTTSGSATAGTTGGSGNVNFTANLPAGSNNKIVVNITGTVDPNATGAFDNTATVTPPGKPAEPSNTVNTVIENKTGLSLSKTGPASGSVNAGDPITYLLELTNAGPSNANGVQLTDVVPADITNVSWSVITSGNATVATGAPASGTGNNISTTVNIPGGATHKIQVRINGTVNPAAKDTLINTARAIFGGNVIVAANKTAVINKPGLQIVKAGPASADAGTTVSYNITVSNAGPSDAVNAAIADVIGVNILKDVKWTATATGNAVVNSGATGTGNTINVNANIPAGSNNKVSIQITATVLPGANGEVRNTATVTVENQPPVVSNEIVTVIRNKPGLILHKAGPATATAGGAISYTLQLSNEGPSDAFDAILLDTLAASIKNATIQVTTQGSAVVNESQITNGIVKVDADIPAGENHQVLITITGTVDPAFTGRISNRGTVSVPGTPPVTSEEVITNVTSLPKLLLEKSAPDTAVAGQQITYTVIVHNLGLSDAVNANIRDVVPAALTNVQWTATATGNATISSGATGTGNNVNVTGNIPAGTGNAITITAKGIIAPSFTGVLENHATGDIPGQPTVTSDTVTTQTVNKPGLQISKAGPGTMVAGDRIRYTVEVTNSGPSDAVNVNITDAVAAVITNSSWRATAGGNAAVLSGATGSGNNVVVTANIPAGNNKVLIVIDGTVSPAATGTIVNNATAAVTGIPPVTASVSTILKSEPAISIDKTGPARINAGENITYVLTATNYGLSDARQVNISDLIPAQITGATWTTSLTGTATITSGATGTGNNVQVTGTLPAGTGNHIFVTVTGKVAQDYAGTLQNFASAFEQGKDTSISDTVTTTVNNLPGVQLVKSAPDTLAAGSNITFTITATNVGPSDAKNISFTDAVPASVKNITWNAISVGNAIVSNGSGTGNNIVFTGDIAAGSGNRIVLTINGTVDPAFTGDIPNVATANIAGQPQVSSNTTITHIVKQTALSVIKAGPAQEAAGGNIAYIISVENEGPSDATGVQFRDTVPAAISGVTWRVLPFGAATVTAGNNGSGNQIAVTANIPAGEDNSILVLVEGKIDPAYNGPSLVNRAVVTSPDEPAPVTDTAITKVINKPGIQLTKNGPSQAAAGDQITYTIHVANSGPSNAVGVTLTDILDNNLLNPSWTAVATGAGTSVSSTSGNTDINITANIPAGGGNSVDITVTGTLNPDFAGTNILNTATATVPGQQPINAVVNTIVNRVADLRVVKSGPAAIIAGEKIRYSIKVTNQGPSNITGAVISDIIPSAILNPSWTATATNATVSAASGTGNVNLTANITAGTGTVDIVVTGTVDPSAANNSTIENTATATPPAGVTDPHPATSTVTTQVSKEADLAIVKSGPANLIAGQELTYQLVVTNRGISDVTGAVITDAVPASLLLTNVTVTSTGNARADAPVTTGNNIQVIGDIAAGPGNTITVTISGTVNPSATGTINNTATVTPPADVTDAEPANNTSTINTNLTTDIGLQVSKSGPATVNVNDQITYDILLINNGISDANNVFITDNVPADITNVVWQAAAIGNATINATSGTGNTINLLGMVGADNSGSIRITVTGKVSNSAANTITNTVTAVSGSSRTSTVVTTVNKTVDLRISKTAPKEIAAGEKITYVIGVTNAGPADVTGALIADVIPAAVLNATWTAVAENGATVAAGSGTGNISLHADIPANNGSVTITVTGTVDPAATGTLTNTATATPPAGVTDPRPATVTVNTNIIAVPGLSINKSGPATVNAGNAITYTLQIRNNGPSVATAVRITDTIPGPVGNVTWSATAGTGAVITDPGTGTGTVSLLADIPVGGTVSVTVRGTTDPAFAGEIINHAEVSSNGGTPVRSNDIVTQVINQPGLSIRKSGPAQVAAGQQISYVINIGNNGPSAAKGIQVNDLLPAAIHNATWSATATGTAAINGGNINNQSGNVVFTADIPAGGTNMVQVTVKGEVDPAASGQLVNIATVTASNGTPISDTATTQVVNTPGIRLIKAGPDTVAAGNVLGYTIDVYNNGPSDATGVNIADILPAQLQDVSWSATAAGAATINGGNLQGQTGNVGFTANIPAGSANVIHITVNGTVIPSFTGTIRNQATATVDGNNITSNDVVTQVAGKSALRISKAGPAKAIAGGNIGYVIILSNDGPSDATGVAVNDVLPPQVRNGVWSATGNGAAVIQGGNISNRPGDVSLIADIPAGANNRIVINVSGSVDPAFTGDITNTASYTHGGTTVPSTPVITNVSAQTGLMITKSGPDTLAAGRNINYTLQVINQGPSDAAGINITDVVPASIQGVTWQAVATGTATLSGSSSGTGNNISINGNIPAGVNNSIQVTITGTVVSQATGTVLNIAGVAVAGKTADQDSVNTVIVNTPGVLFTKSGPQEAVAGNNISYTLDLTNAGPSDLVNAVVKDLVPAQVQNVSWTIVPEGSATLPVGTPLTGTGNLVEFRANVPAGDANRIHVIINGKTNPDFAGTITNRATVTDANGKEYTGVVNTRIRKISLLSINKIGPAEAAAGEVISYVITAANQGPSDAAGITITDVIPATITQVTWTAVANGNALITGPAAGTGSNISVQGNIAAGSANNITITVTGTIPAATTAASVTNTASLLQPDGTTQVTDPVVTVIKQVPGISLQKIAPVRANAGDSLRYLITIFNNGPSDAANIAISDVVPATLTGVSWTASVTGNARVISGAAGTGNNISLRAAIAAGAGNAITLQINGRIDPAFEGSIRNQATADAAGVTTPSNEVVTTVVRSAKLSIQKTGSAQVSAGDTIRYVITAANAGPSNATGITITDIVPATITTVSWTAITSGNAQITGGASGTGNSITVQGNIAGGAGNTIQVMIKGVVPANTTADRVTNTATLQPPGGDPIVTDPVTTNIIKTAAIKLVKTAPATANAGDNLPYVITITNAGPSDATGITISDVVPATLTGVSWTATTTGNAQLTGNTSGTGNNVSLQGNIAAGAGNSITLTISGTIDPGFTGSIRNQASADHGGVPAVSNEVETVVSRAAGLSIQKTGPAQVKAGDAITYVITAANAGPSNATGITITDLVPADVTGVTWTATTAGNAQITGATSGTGNNITVLGNIAGGTGNTIQITINGVVAAGTTATTITNTATGKEPDGGSITSVPVITNVTKSPGLHIVKTAPAGINAGDNLPFTITVTNDGPSDAMAVNIRDVVPATLTGVTWTATATGTAQVTGATSGSGNNVQVQAAIPAGTGNSIVINITGKTATSFTGTITNQATLNTGGGDVTSNTTTTTVGNSSADLAVTKSGPAEIRNNAVITYLLVAQNNGPAKGDGAIVTDVVPAAVTGVTATIQATTGGATAQAVVNGNTVRVTAGNFPAGSTIRIAITGTVNGIGQLKNQANITVPPGTVDPDPGNNTSTEVVTAIQSADVQLVKTLQTGGPLQVGGKADFLITVNNAGPSTATGIIVRDTLNSNLELVGGFTVSNGTTTYDPISRILVWTPDNLQVSQTATLRFTTRITRPGVVVNAASVTATLPDPDLSNNRSVTNAVTVTGDDIFIPNVITPNGDGKNDKFKIIDISRYPNSSLFIYNRWGNMVYQSKNYQNTWDGEGLNEGTYYYVLKLNTPNGERSYKGWIELLR